ncbi:MAG: S9 family peptidase [Gemmatimonadota bacterium]
MTRLPRFAALASATLLAAPLAAQQLTIDRIFADREFAPARLPNLAWMADGQRFTFIETRADGATDLIVEDAASGDRSVLVDGSSLLRPGDDEPITIDAYAFDDGERRLLIQTDQQGIYRRSTRGTYYVLDLATGALQPIAASTGDQQYAKLSPDGDRVGFVRANDVWVADLSTGAERRLTFDGSETVINGTFDWVYEEELSVVDGWSWSPDGGRIAFWHSDQSPIDIFSVQDLSELYPTSLDLPYPKAGDPNSIVSIGVIDLGEAGMAEGTGSGITWVDTGDETDIYLARMRWTPDGEALFIERLNRHQNRLEMLSADPASGESAVVMVDEDEAYVDVDFDFTWVDGGERFIWTSERDGWNHLYLYNRDGSLERQLTDGEWEVNAYHGLDRDNGWAYFSAAKESPLTRDLYRVRLDGGEPERLTRGGGSHAVAVAPGFRYFIDTHTTVARPGSTVLHRADGRAVRTLVDNEALVAKLAGMGLRDPEFITVPAADGTPLNAWITRPASFDENQSWPVLMYVYGGPGSQTVRDSWGGDRYLWHQALAERGYVVVSVDNRGTGARGRDFKKQTYLQLGKLESDDQIAAARWLADQPYVDRDRLGIWGWSYGGYMTLLSMLREGGDVFSAGISVAPVTHWKLYDTIYTERYMRTPRENPGGYEDWAPTNIAAELTGDLLLVHGAADDNVHFQQSSQMVDAFIDAGVQFEFMMYPGRAHAIRRRNAQPHLFTMLTNWLEEHLPAGASEVARATS